MVEKKGASCSRDSDRSLSKAWHQSQISLREHIDQVVSGLEKIYFLRSPIFGEPRPQLRGTVSKTASSLFFQEDAVIADSDLMAT